jgi:uncharacterized protein (TIGR02996 family)
MKDDAGFIRAIQENLNDDALRLVYADWLEERGDIRGEYLRLECLLTQLPVRLTQLREQIDPAWLIAVCKRRRVVLLSFLPGRKIETIRLVQEITWLGLREAKELVESTRSTIKDNLSIADAEKVARRFEGIAVVAIEPSVGG